MLLLAAGFSVVVMGSLVLVMGVRLPNPLALFSKGSGKGQTAGDNR